MHVRLRARALGASILGAAALAAGLTLTAVQARAAAIVQTQSFSAENVVTLRPTYPDHEDQFPSGDVTKTTPLSFQAFDPALGALTAVELTLTGAQDFTTGVSIVIPLGATNNTVANSVGHYRSDVMLAGQDLDAYDLPPGLGEQLCYTYVDACLNVKGAHRDQAIDRLFADLSPFLAPSPVELDLTSEVSFSGLTQSLGAPPPIVTFSTGLEWSGEASLTYIYLPVAGPPDGGGGPAGGVPEPAAWALMLAGFGLAGATLRHGRRTAALSPPVRAA